MKRLARTEEFWLGMTSGAINSIGEFSRKALTVCQSEICSSIALYQASYLEQDSCRQPRFLILMAVNKLLIIKHSHLLSNLLLTATSVYYCAVLSPDPVRPGVPLCQEQLSFLRREMLSHLNRSVEGFQPPGKCSVVEKAAVLWREWEGALWLQVTLNDLSELTQES